MKLTRRAMLGYSMGGLMAAGAIKPQDDGSQSGADFYRSLVKANDARIPNLIISVGASNPRTLPIRRMTADLQALAAAFCAPESAFYQSQSLVAPMESASRFFLAAQHRDGTIDSGNLESPPDTGFVVETTATALSVLRKNDSASLRPIKENLGKFLLAAGEPLTTGGVHTPNHRWVVSAALARLHALFPAAKYVARINDWLDEGIDIDSDGQFCERSTGIYSQVTDAALITMARLLGREELLDPVRKNLEMSVYYAHPDGEIETVGSRRQDQFMIRSIAAYYLEYRYLAIKERNHLFAGMARWIEGLESSPSRLVGSLIYFLDEPLLRERLPESRGLPDDYARHFPNSGLARIRRGKVSATVYGGSDWPMGVASGLASNPTFFTFRKGRAVLESVRMAASFFSKGHFRSMGLKGNGNQYLLEQRLEVPYYQPLPKAERNARGEYRLTPAEDRFWSEMNFPKRRMSEMKSLDQKVTITEKNGVFELGIDVAGPDRVPVVIELSFRRGGKLEGVRQTSETNVFFLDRGMGVYRAGDDVIEFGPGRSDHDHVSMEGASYTAHRGNLKPAGDCVYITGFTPFHERILVK